MAARRVREVHWVGGAAPTVCRGSTPAPPPAAAPAPGGVPMDSEDPPPSRLPSTVVGPFPAAGDTPRSGWADPMTTPRVEPDSGAASASGPALPPPQPLLPVLPGYELLEQVG